MIQQGRRSKKRKGPGCGIDKVFGLVVVVGLSVFVILHLNVVASTNSKISSALDGWFPATTSISSALDDARLPAPWPKSTASALQPIDLSVNHLQQIPFWQGALHKEIADAATTEDFLPVVLPSQIDLRWRLATIAGAPAGPAIQHLSAYQIIGQQAHAPHAVVWDSGKTVVPNADAPRMVEWNTTAAPLTAGSIIQWKILIWDGRGSGPATSEWSKFAVGPDQWTAQWITHPTDYESLTKLNKVESRSFVKKSHIKTTNETCQAWRQRMPLPVARARFSLEPNKIASAMLFVSGLGMYSATLNAKRLTSASVHDPPLTDFSQRVMYRGFDVTQELLQQPGDQHVLGISLASGWWDARPIRGSIVYMEYMPKGSLTTIAELHITYKDGTSNILIPTNSSGDWKMGKGYLRQSNLYTGEVIDLVSFDNNRGWNDNSPSQAADVIDWVSPQVYTSNMTNQEWRKRLDTFATTKVKQEIPWLAPIGQLTPMEIPPVMPMYRIPPVSTSHLGSGRWLIDFGKSMSGVVRFENGLPPPIKLSKYPRGHDLSMIMPLDNSYISVIHGDSLEMTTGDVNLALVAGFGHHNGGERGVAKDSNVGQRGGPCFPAEDLKNYQALTQRDVYMVTKADRPNDENDDAYYFGMARQPQFTVHGFRFAEVCCTKDPPTDAYAIQYRTAFQKWGEFRSSNPVLNGAFEMTQNALESNMLGVQSDCPHRERLQYGGDIVAVSPSAMHMFDVSAFYGKIIHDWTESQWENGAYGVTSVFMDLLDDRAIAGRGSGEMMWASVAPIINARHMQHYGDTKLALRYLNHHVEWLDFLNKYWEEGAKLKFQSQDHWQNGFKVRGLGDWLGMIASDYWLTDHSFYMASARAVAYLASKILETASQVNGNGAPPPLTLPHTSLVSRSYNKTKELERVISSIYKYKNFAFSDKPHRLKYSQMGQNLGLFARIANGENRCAVLRSMLEVAGDSSHARWPGDEESLHHEHLEPSEYKAMTQEEHIFFMTEWNQTLTRYKYRYAINQGIFGIRWSQKALSETGFHSVALTKASGEYFPGFGMMMSFNATTLWETWWRSEDIYSRNHPMFGAVADWLSTAVAGVGLSPTTVGGDEVLLWPRIPDTRQSAIIVQHAGAIQGTKHGDAAIAWKLVNSEIAPNRQEDKKNVVVRALVPPGTTAVLRLPLTLSLENNSVMPRAAFTTVTTMPDFNRARDAADTQCEARRQAKQGFPFHWEYNSVKETWRRVYKKKKIGTPCESFLFHVDEQEWIELAVDIISEKSPSAPSVRLQPGFYEVTIDDWTLREDLSDEPGYKEYNGTMGPYCFDPSTFEWDIDDAEHLI